MTADQEVLQDLLRRVESATGADREIGREILLALGWQRTLVGHFHGPLYYWSPPGSARSSLSGKDDDLPDITTSLDAALALVERVLPGWLWEVTTITTGVGGIRYPTALVMSPDHAPGEEIQTFGEARTPALALLAALLKALIAEQAAGQTPESPQ